MKSSYREQDYAFGQTMLTLRSKIGLTQTGLADFLGISRRSVADWEAGSKYPKPQHLQALITLAFEHEAFPAGSEAEAIRALWRASRQKLLLDERWVAELISLPTPNAPRQALGWNSGVTVQSFYGRTWELNLLKTWIIEEKCRVASIIGLGGIGKSALTVNLIDQISESFDSVVWRSVRDAPPCEVLIDDMLQALIPDVLAEPLETLDQRLLLLMEALRKHRILLVLDNVETLLEEGSNMGRMRHGYEGYGKLLSRLAETEHQSVLVLTSREKPHELMAMEGNQSPVRSLRINRLDLEPCEQILAEKGVTGTPAERARLIEAYSGNPLALKIVAQTMADLFGGAITAFFEQGEVIFGGVQSLLATQIDRLSPLEQNILLWLAVLREPASFDDLVAVQKKPSTRARLMESVEALYRRSLIERGDRRGTFTLQSVVLEYLTASLIHHVSDAIQHARWDVLTDYAVELAGTREYVRQTQRRLILMPILDQLNAFYPQPEAVETVLLEQLDQARSLPESVQGYAPANLINLLYALRGHLRELDLSGLMLRGVSLQGVEMQDAKMTGVLLRDCVFTENFDSIAILSVSSHSDRWAIVSTKSEIRVWTDEGRTLFRIWTSDTGSARRIAVSPDGQTLVGHYLGGKLNLWDITRGVMLWSSGFDKGGTAFHLDFSPDGNLIASTGDQGVYLWDHATGMLRDTLEHPNDAPYLAWSPDSSLLATGSADGVLRIWKIRRDLPAESLSSIKAHTNVISGIAFSPDGSQLITASWDGTVKMWLVSDGSLQETLTGHKNRMYRAAWRSDGRLIASGESDGTILLWDVEKRQYRAAMRRHTDILRGLAFTPDNRMLVSGSPDGTIIVWDAETGTPNRILQGYRSMIHMVMWSGDSQKLVSNSSDPMLTVYTLNEEHPPHNIPMLKDAREISWSPDGRTIATHRYDHTVRLWDAETGKAVGSISYPDQPEGYFNSVVWSPDSATVVVGVNNYGLHTFDPTSQTLREFGEIRTRIGQLFFSPNGRWLAGLSTADSVAYVMDWETGATVRTFSEHESALWSLGWSADSQKLAIVGEAGGRPALFIWDFASGTATRLQIDLSSAYAVDWGARDETIVVGERGGFVRWWDIATGECVQEIQAHRGNVTSIMISPDRLKIASSGDDGQIHIYDAETFALLKTLRRDRPYERMDITGVRGLNDAQIANLQALGAVESS